MVARFTYGAPRHLTDIDQSLVDSIESMSALLADALRVLRDGRNHPGQVEARAALRGLLRAEADITPLRAFVRYAGVQSRNKEKHLGY